MNSRDKRMDNGDIMKNVKGDGHFWVCISSRQMGDILQVSFG